MIFVDVHVGALEDGLGVGFGTSAHVLLTKTANLRLDRNRLLRSKIISAVSGDSWMMEYVQAARREAPS